VLADVDSLIQVWEDNPDLLLGDLTLLNVKAKRENLRARNQLVDEARTDLSRLIDEASDVRDEAEQIITRGRSGIRATFGPNSAQYAQVGGTRASERKPRSSKAKAAGVKSTT
jgi:hypothetical protein